MVAPEARVGVIISARPRAGYTFTPPPCLSPDDSHHWSAPRNQPLRSVNHPLKRGSDLRGRSVEYGADMSCPARIEVETGIPDCASM